MALARGESHDFVGGERPLGQNPQHFAAHIAGGADDGDLETHGEFPKKPRPLRCNRWGGRRVLMGNEGQFNGGIEFGGDPGGEDKPGSSYGFSDKILV